MISGTDTPRIEWVLMYRWEGRLYELWREETLDAVWRGIASFFIHGPGKLRRLSCSDYVLVQHVYL